LNEGQMIKELGEKIQKEREHQGLSRAELHKASGVPSRTIQDIEGGKSAATITTLAAIAAGLRIPLEELLHGVSNTDGSEPSHSAGARAELLVALFQDALQLDHIRLSKLRRTAALFLDEQATELKGDTQIPK
jgi:transcriptional regulator with XRE-family HTH domain